MLDQSLQLPPQPLGLAEFVNWILLWWDSEEHSFPHTEAQHGGLDLGALWREYRQEIRKYGYKEGSE